MLERRNGAVRIGSECAPVRGDLDGTGVGLREGGSQKRLRQVGHRIQYIRTGLNEGIPGRCEGGS